MNQMLIRSGTRSDFAGLQNVEVAAFETLREAGSVSGLPTASSDEELQRFLDEDLLYVACDVDGAAIAYSGGYVVDGLLYIAEVDVLPAWQRRGLGRSLVTTMIDAARRKRVAGAMLTTDRLAPFNAPFYKRLGFQVVEGDAVHPHLRSNLDRQVANGLDPSRRVAMVLLF